MGAAAIKKIDEDIQGTLTADRKGVKRILILVKQQESDKLRLHKKNGVVATDRKQPGQ